MSGHFVGYRHESGAICEHDEAARLWMNGDRICALAHPAPLDEKGRRIRQEALERLALGMDLPLDMLTSALEEQQERADAVEMLQVEASKHIDDAKEALAMAEDLADGTEQPNWRHVNAASHYAHASAATASALLALAEQK